jgi:hypothetical protein
LSDEETRQEIMKHPRFDVPEQEPWPLRQEAIEVAWLLGKPFFVQLIPAVGDGISTVVVGSTEACREGDRLLDAGWRPVLARRPQTVVATLSGDPSRHTFADLARAFAAAARVVQPNGRIVLLTEALPLLGVGVELLRMADDPQNARVSLERAGIPEMAPALQWAQAASHARLSILSNLPEETVEELFASPLTSTGQAQYLIANGGDCLVLRDAHRMMPVLE